MIKKLLFLLFLINQITGADVNPGIIVFISKTVSQSTLTKNWKNIERSISLINIQYKFPESGPIQFSHFRFRPIVSVPNQDNIFDVSTNSLELNSVNFKFHAKSTAIINFSGKHAKGNMSINGKFDNLMFKLGFSTQTKSLGDIPKFVLKATNTIQDDHVIFSSHEFIFKDILPMITNNYFGLRTKAVIALNNVLSAPDTWPNLQAAINEQLMTSYPTEFKIPNYDLSVSTYTTGGITVHKNSISFPLEGFFFDSVQTGYKKYDCKSAVSTNFDYDIVTSLGVIILGECFVMSLLKVTENKGITQDLVPPFVNNKNIKDLKLKMVNSEQSNIEFTKDLVQVTIGVSLQGIYMNYKLSGTSDIMINTSFRKQSIDGDNGLDGTHYKVEFSVAGIKSLLVDGIPDSLSELVKGFLTSSIIGVKAEQVIKIPNYCIPDTNICMSKSDISIEKGYIKVLFDI